MNKKDNGKWIYEKADGFRYVLGNIKGKDPLICFGVNPSCATPECLDTTVNIVRRFSERIEKNGWIMLNVYPQRATDPNDLKPDINTISHEENLKHIKDVLKEYPNSEIWASWGNLITKRPYLKECVKEIFNENKSTIDNWKIRGELTTKGHPHHPLGIGKDIKLTEFNIEKYIKKI